MHRVFFAALSATQEDSRETIAVKNALHIMLVCTDHWHRHQIKHLQPHTTLEILKTTKAQDLLSKDEEVPTWKRIG